MSKKADFQQGAQGIALKNMANPGKKGTGSPVVDVMAGMGLSQTDLGM